MTQPFNLSADTCERHATPVQYPELLGLAWMALDETDLFVSVIHDGATVIEFGTASGVTASIVASAKPKASILSVDQFYPCDADDPYYESSCDRISNWFRNRQPNQNLFVGTTAQFCALCSHRFDVGLVDAGHHFDEVSSDLVLMRSIIKPDGIILAHDYGCETWPGVQNAVDQFCRESGWRISNRIVNLVALKHG